VCCPFHAGGEERTPSLHVYPNDRGWACFGCGRGGTIVDFGAHLYGIEPRGGGFHELRRRLVSELVPALRRAAA
jgi:DNA primase